MTGAAARVHQNPSLVFSTHLKHLLDHHDGMKEIRTKVKVFPNEFFHKSFRPLPHRAFLIFLHAGYHRALAV
tara:strand:+ start:1578 stop:1793 length:216 start_codon:yes stop_codon:yes gene_type:complete